MAALYMSPNIFHDKQTGIEKMMNCSKIKIRPEFFIFAFFASFYLLVCRGEFYAIDEMARYGLTKTIVLERDLTLTRPDGSSVYVPWPILQSVLAIPLFVLGHLFSRGGAIAKEENARLFVSFFNPIVGALACTVYFRLSRILNFRTSVSLISTLIFGLCTIFLPYSRTFLSEPLTGLLLMSGFLFAFKSSRQNPYPAFLSGLFLAMAAVNNYVAMFSFAAIFLYVLFQDGKLKEKLSQHTLKDARLWVLPVFGLAAFLWVSWYDKLVYGSIIGGRMHFFKTAPNLLYPDGLTGFAYPIFAGLYGFIFSPGDSIFLFSPPLLVALVAWPKFLKTDYKKAVALLSVPLVYLLVHSKFGDWWGGYSWGPRFLVPVTGLLLLPLGIFIEGFSRLRLSGKAALTAVILAGLYVQFTATILPPFLGYVKMLRHLGGDSMELMMQYLPQACPVVLQTQELRNITGIGATDLFFLKNIGSVNGALLPLAAILTIFLLTVAWLIALLVSTARNLKAFEKSEGNRLGVQQEEA
jgi:hypothetical protein